MKEVAIIISGAPEGDNIRDLTIQPGASAGDVLRAVELQNYLLSREGSGQHFADNEEIYPHIEDGSKLRATPVAEVGVNWLTQIWAWLTGASNDAHTHTANGRESSPVAVRPPATERTQQPVSAPTLPPRSGSIRVHADRRPLSEIRGWRRQGDKLVGAFRTPWRSFAGEISLDAHKPSFLIIDPPETVLKGPHAACFRPRGGGRYHIHFGRNPRPNNIDAGIVAVEKLICQSIAPKHRSK